jgi:membrane protein YqaA with SNARE-associated domain
MLEVHFDWLKIRPWVFTLLGMIFGALLCQILYGLALVGVVLGGAVGYYLDFLLILIKSKKEENRQRREHLKNVIEQSPESEGRNTRFD